MRKRMLTICCVFLSLVLSAGCVSVINPDNAVEEETLVLYDLSEDGEFIKKSPGEEYGWTAILQNAGASFQTVDYDGGKSLHVSGRTDGNWRGMDIKFDGLGLSSGTELTIGITGRFDGETPDNSQIVLCAVDSYSYLHNPAPAEDGSFQLSATVLVDDALLSANRAFRVMTNNEAMLVNFYIDSILITYIPVEIEENTEASAEIDLEESEAVVLDTTLIGFSADALAVTDQLLIVTPNASAECETAEFENDHDGDGFALKAWHNPDSDDYTATPNGIRIAFNEPLPENNIYHISAWFYVPSQGNADVEGKAHLIGPSILLNDNPASNAHKFPTSEAAAGIIEFDKWIQVEFETALFTEPLSTIDLRFYTNVFANHAEIWYIDDITVQTISSEGVAIPEWDLTLPSLADKYANKFLIGNVMEPVQTEDAAITEMYNIQYNAVTAENAMKPVNISPALGEYNYEQADKIADWAEENNQILHGHTLVWHSQSALHLTADAEGNALTYDEARANMEDYIANVAGHFAGRVVSWDVVNEAFENSVDYSGDWKEGLRADSPWYIAYANGGEGSDYIYDAFKLARKYDPVATLYYNDFNDQEPGKSQAISAMVTELNEQWETDPDYDGRMLIEGIGMQSHHNTDILSISDFRDALERYIATGAVISLTELDITVGSVDPYPAKELTEEDEIAQALLYAQIFEILEEYSEHIERVTFWAKADSQSWRGGRLPGIFDGQFAPKESFFAILDPASYLAK